jgi:surface antigen
MRYLRTPAALLLATLLVAPAMAAGPPAHAPAHGYRDKQARKFRGYTGVEWQEDYGVSSGRCNTDTVLTVIGAAGGAVIGNRTASSENRAIATVLGAVIGGVIGNEVGERIDEADRACMGHALEVAAAGRSVSWTNPRTHVAYTVVPVRDLKDGCRLFELRPGAQARGTSLTACRSQSAVWQISKR